MTVISTILNILLALLIFGIIIMIHEWGHFRVAKWCHIQVNEFAIGMGPRLLKLGKGETVYSLRAFPIGGFCAMEGEDDESDNPRAFGNQKVWKRMLVVLAGPVMNLILGYVMMVMGLAICVQPTGENETALYGTTTIAYLPEEALAYETGLRVGDTIVKVNGKRIWSDFDLMYLMQTNDDEHFSMVVKRETDGKVETVTLEDVQFPYSTDDTTGVSTIQYEFKLLGVQKSFISTLNYAGKMEVSFGVLVWRSLGGLITGQYKLNDLSGPVGTVTFIGDAVSEAVQSAKDTGNLDALYYLFEIIVLITVNVGIFNLLPIPALDGGRFMFLFGFFCHFRAPNLTLP